MIIFERFRVTNAGPFREFDLNLKNRGLVRMSGANGQGKSSVWHLFTQNHYAITPNAAKKSDLMMADKDYLLETTFTKNGSQYVAAQAVKSKTLAPNGTKYDTGVYLFRDGTDISMHKDPDTQKLIKSTMGWSLEEWFGYVYLAQQTTHTLINGTRSERQTYLSALFNMFWIDIVASTLNQKAKSLAEQIDGVEAIRQEYHIKAGLLNGRNPSQLEESLSSIQEGISFLDEQLSYLRTEQESFNRKQSLIKELSNLEPPSKSLEDLNQELSILRELQSEYDAQAKAIEALRSQLAGLKSFDPPEIPKDYEEVMAKPSIDIAQVKKEHAALSEIEQGLVEVRPVVFPSDMDEVLSSPDLNEAQTEARIQKIKNRPAPPAEARPSSADIEALQTKKTDLWVEISTLKARIKALEFNEDTCPTCGTTLDCKDRTQELEDKKAELLNVTELHSEISSELQAVQEVEKKWRSHDALGPDESGELPELEASLAMYRKKKQYRAFELQAQKHQTYTESLKRLESLPYYEEQLKLHEKKVAYSLLTSKKEAFEKYQAEKARLETELQTATQNQGADLKEELLRVEAEIKSAEAYARIQTEIDARKTEDQTGRIQLLTNEIAEQQVEAGAIRHEVSEVKTLAESIESLQKQLAESEGLYREKTKYELLAKGYGKAGQLRERQLSKFSKYLEEAVLSHTIRQLPKHRFKIVVDDGIDILAIKDGDRPEPYDVKFMSGGEKGALSVAFLFALDDLLPPDRRTNLKILDEIEGAFDGDRKKDFIEFTLPELRKRAETIVVISHSEAANHGVFDTTWEIKDGKILEHNAEHREFVIEN